MSDQNEIRIEPEDLDESVVSEEQSAEIIKKLRERLKVCQKERGEYLDGWQRAKADFVNARKDDEKAMSQFVKFSNERIIRDIIPALDSFHSAFGNKANWEKVDLNWRMGVQYIYSQLFSALEKNGITLIEPKIGEPFDTQKHESVSTVPVSDPKENHTVIEVVQKGYALHGNILQPAKVKLAEYHQP
ncbi:MAG TPA: nucleotide exchange factor GrpE [Candidatus Taylorbacteria bacterium]|nr:MAG: Protein GrpE [Parcubacteria group bacterium GW2011_GWA2_47_64]KKU96064.1 MAG: Protein GrpE [Parcubacteria group bacterium GW2011_GWC2_48_17]HBV00815.1 nucleotide exchange factor GrpE [Candidatus Taylorbacteria bacterium]